MLARSSVLFYMSQPEPALIPALLLLARLSEYPDLALRVSLDQTTAVQCPSRRQDTKGRSLPILVWITLRPSSQPAGPALPAGRHLHCSAALLPTPVTANASCLAKYSHPLPGFALFLMDHASYRLLIMSGSWSTLISLHPEAPVGGGSSISSHPLRKRSPVFPPSLLSRSSDLFRHLSIPSLVFGS
ncbi:hypothetical protein BDW67DRAFT_74542 [Aspergillus spinulosporus]